jgi:hypothetical protein
VCVCVCVCGAGVWTEGLMFARQSLYYLSHSAHFRIRCFWDRVSWSICLGWLWTMILLISASQVVRITGVSHRHLVCRFNFLRNCQAAFWSNYNFTLDFLSLLCVSLYGTDDNAIITSVLTRHKFQKPSSLFGVFLTPHWIGEFVLFYLPCHWNSLIGFLFPTFCFCLIYWFIILVTIFFSSKISFHSTLSFLFLCWGLLIFFICWKNFHNCLLKHFYHGYLKNFLSCHSNIYDPSLGICCGFLCSMRFYV